MILHYRQVDVFADGPLAGNGLAVFVTNEPLEAQLMQALTRELRQFESIFLSPSSKPASFAARVFTMEEELPFAGHPAIGAAAVLHEIFAQEEHECELLLPAGAVPLNSRRKEGHYEVSMDQGRVHFGSEIEPSQDEGWLAAFGLRSDHLDRRLPISIASTGLPYVVIPVTGEGLSRARVIDPELEQRLARVGAKFAYLLDVERREGRTWDNGGAVEDIATGSAAGPVAGLLVRHGLADVGKEIIIRQGRFLGRPSEMGLIVREGSGQGALRVTLSGKVVMVARGQFDEDIPNRAVQQRP